MSRTIAAVATPAGTGGIGIVRISGENSITVADRVFRSVSGAKIAEKPGYTALFGKVFDGETAVDEAVALIFRSPKSYTGEDTVELSVHGGDFVVRKVLRTVLDAGAVLAERGEFTRRAFENGKTDLAGAEAVMDIISAGGEQALRAGFAAHTGAVTKKCSEIRDRLTFAAATVAAYSDYPDEEPEFSGIDRLGSMLSEAKAELKTLVDNYDVGRMIRNGIETAIIGPPNAGKSTLMNLLSGFDRSIVTDVAGTTRDSVEETVRLGDITLRLCDTAGLRDTDDTVERIGVKRTLEKMKSADLIIAVFDGSVPSAETEKLLLSVKDRNTVAVFNKSDIKSPDTSAAEKLGVPYVVMSAKTGSGEDRLIAAIKESVGMAALDGNASFYLNERQRNCAVRALGAVDEALSALQSGVTVDAVGVCLDEGLAALLELTGERVTVEVANKVFEHFCVGK